MFDYPNWVWFLLEVLVTIIGILLEKFFSISERVRRFFFLIFNRTVSLELTLWVKSELPKSLFNKEILDLLKKEGLVNKVKRDTPFTEILLNRYDTNLVIRQHSKGIYIIDFEKIKNGLWYIKRDLRDLVTLFTKINKGSKIDNISFNIYLPYNWIFVKNNKPSNYKLNEYAVRLTNGEDTHVQLNLQRIKTKNREREFEKISSQNKDLTELKNVLNDFTSLF